MTWEREDYMRRQDAEHDMISMRDPRYDVRRLASVAGAGTAKTAQPVEGEARQNGAQSADAQPSPPSD